ncbi:MAG: anthranilate phosphoribosyltransferase [Candidatus Omnitrophota bacterium]|nr:MAG: anthranilate phosphoribosyltransferase [Candidatus Omnitrophota bacterium]
MIEEAIKKIKNSQDLSEKETERVFTEIMKGEAETEKIASFLIALKEKKESVDEITGAATVMRRFATKINPKKERLLDTCGTGGDCADTFNISTISAFVACGAGCSVAKHGNKAVSSKCGSADLLEALGVNIDVDKGVVEKCINELGIGFLFAPKLHLAMKYAMPARRMIKTRSIFNILGPLTNPAGAKFQLLGVYDEDLVVMLANVLKNLGSVRAMVVCGKDGLDEITTTGITAVAELKDNRVRTHIIKPEDFGFASAKKEDLKGGDTDFNVAIAMEILNGKKGPGRDIVLLNAGAAIYVAGVVSGLTEGIKKAGESIDSGRALEKLEKLKELTNT